MRRGNSFSYLKIILNELIGYEWSESNKREQFPDIMLFLMPSIIFKLNKTSNKHVLPQVPP